jgi:hypothetical protein
MMLSVALLKGPVEGLEGLLDGAHLLDLVLFIAG